MLTLFQGRFPAIKNPVTGELVIFVDNARGWQEASAIVKDVRKELRL